MDIEKVIEAIDSLREVVVGLKVAKPEIAPGTLCYFWNGERPKCPIIRPFHSTNGVGYKTVNIHGEASRGLLSHCEPVELPTVPKLGLKLWFARDDGAGFVYMFLEKPEKKEKLWSSDQPYVEFNPPEGFPALHWEDDEPLCIEV